VLGPCRIGTGCLLRVCTQLIRLFNCSYYVKYGYADLPDFNVSEIDSFIEWLCSVHCLGFSFSLFVYIVRFTY